MSFFTKELHNRMIYNRRMTRLTELLSFSLTDSHNILDLGCGDGKIDSLILNRRNDISIQGIDVLVRPNTFISVKEYDGKHIPYDDAAFDTVMSIDVLHHTDEPLAVLREMTRVSGKYIIIKDHIRTGFWTYFKLRMMDYVGNSHYNVRLPYNYQTTEQWNNMFENCGLKVIKYQTKLQLYTGVFHIFFDRDLHFLATLEKKI